MTATENLYVIIVDYDDDSIWLNSVFEISELQEQVMDIKEKLPLSNIETKTLSEHLESIRYTYY